MNHHVAAIVSTTTAIIAVEAEAVVLVVVDHLRIHEAATADRDQGREVLRMKTRTRLEAIPRAAA